MTVRTRMAPSPTGEYHIGGMRTLLYNYAFARKNKGKFIIRVEDTDRTRYVDGAEERALDVINDYGFDWDEGPRVGGPYAPYVQSDRLGLYKKYADELVAKGAAYYCFCTSERLTNLREDQRKQGLAVTKYDKHCLHLGPEEVKKKLEEGQDYVIRLNVPANCDVSFHDLILGDILVNTDDIDDQVLLKSDGFPTYQLAVVVDDHLMNITHVMRGIEWLPSTPKHVLLYKAFGWELPIHAHLPNLKEAGENKKLSKRHGSVSAIGFLEEGYLPEAINNFLMFLGWNPGTEKEIYSLEEFINDFSIEKVHKTDLVVFDRDKLLWFNGHYLRALTDEALYERIKNWAGKFNVALNFSHDDTYNLRVVGLIKERLKKLSEVNELTSYFYFQPEIPRDILFSYTKVEERTKEILSSFSRELNLVEKENWTRDNLDKMCHDVITKYEYTPKEAFMTLRVALTGQTATPHIFDILEVLGREESLSRIQSAQQL